MPTARNTGKAMRPFKAIAIKRFEKSTQFKLRFVGSEFPRNYKLPNSLTGVVLAAGGWKLIKDMDDAEFQGVIDGGEATFCAQTWLIEKNGIQTSSVQTVKGGDDDTGN